MQKRFKFELLIAPSPMIRVIRSTDKARVIRKSKRHVAVQYSFGV